MQYLVVIEKGESSYGAYVPDLPGCVAVAETEGELQQLIREAVTLHVEDLLSQGKPAPAPSSSSTLVEVSAA